MTQRLKEKAHMFLTTKTSVFRDGFRTACVAGSFIGDAGERGLEAKEWKCEQKLREEFYPILPMTSTQARAPISPDHRSLTSVLED